MNKEHASEPVASSTANNSEQFYQLTPERVLSAVEGFGVRCTGRCLALNSMENRVYELELDRDAAPQPETELTPPRSEFRVAKFYRPGRWTHAQIAEEHRFIADLQRAEVPVIAPIPDSSGETIRDTGELGIFVALFPKARGRNPDELNDEQLEWLGRLIARLHLVGASSPAPSRLSLDEKTYGLTNLQYLVSSRCLPLEVESAYSAIVTRLCELYAKASAGVKTQRIHGDCHQGNILWGADGPFFLDFDDMAMGPVVQDLWLLISGRDDDGHRQLNSIVSGYEQMRDFDRRELRLIEGLRALRYVNYSAWIARRWSDPMFKRVFPHFGTTNYWQGQLADIREQVDLFERALDQNHLNQPY
jgi:Ser/Thr protein kinase RdoA (MazF antagonist)